MADNPKRRATDRGWRRLVKDNWYRDLWLLAITVIVVYSSLAGYSSNRNRIDDICRATNAQNMAIRSFVRQSIPKRMLNRPETRAYLRRLDRSFPIMAC